MVSDPAGCLEAIVWATSFLYVKAGGGGGGPIFLGSCIIKSASNTIVYAKVLGKALQKGYNLVSIIAIPHLL